MTICKIDLKARGYSKVSFNGNNCLNLALFNYLGLSEDG